MRKMPRKFAIEICDTITNYAIFCSNLSWRINLSLAFIKKDCIDHGELSRIVYSKQIIGDTYVFAYLTSWYLISIEYRLHPSIVRIPALIHTCILLLRYCRVWIQSKPQSQFLILIHTCMHVRAHTYTYTYIYTDVTSIEQMWKVHICNWLVLGFLTFIIVQPSCQMAKSHNVCYVIEAASLMKYNITLHSRC